MNAGNGENPQWRSWVDDTRAEAASRKPDTRTHPHSAGLGMTSERNRARMISRLTEAGPRDERMLNAMMNVQRHRFVDEALANMAYRDKSLPIGLGQTISQPGVVARMTEALLSADRPLEKVLEVGTGSGYQAAVLAQIVDTVYTTERLGALHARAKALLQDLGYRNIRLQHSDGSWGWPEHGPYDAIIVTAGGESIPDALLSQMADGAVMVMPLGQAGQQQLIRIRRTGHSFTHDTLGEAVFVPLLTNTD